MSITHRINELIKHLDISIRAFEKSIGVNAGRLQSGITKEVIPGIDLIEAIIKAYPNVSLYWLVLGAGNMLIDSNLKARQAPSELINFPTNKSDSSTVINQDKYTDLLEKYAKVLSEKNDLIVKYYNLKIGNSPRS